MNKRKYIEDLLIAVIISIIFLFIDYKISIGVLVGYLFACLNFKLIEYRYNHLETYNVWFIIGTIIGIGILALPLLLSVLYPSFMSWIGVFIGLMIIRTRIIIEAILNK